MESGPEGELPPFQIKLTFKEGGVGVFLPMFFPYLEGARRALFAASSSGGGYTPPEPIPPSLTGSTGSSGSTAFATAFVDPSDPTVVFATPLGYRSDQQLDGEDYIYKKKKE